MIGETIKNIDEKSALKSITHMGLALDLALRGVQKELKKQGLPWGKVKCFDGSCPISDPIRIDSSIDFENIEFKLFKNNFLQQQGNTGNMIYSIGQLISETSKHFCLNKGDVILTGTPSGVSPLLPGDVLKASLYVSQNHKIEIDSQVI